ncbi:MAG TPA: hypothetical protein VMI73_21350 [Trebonia sp.]|nr:hypothetical protein [Trebonia sp.]
MALRALRLRSVCRAVKVIAADEDNHLAYCHQERLRLATAGYRREIESLLRTTARAEIAVYRSERPPQPGRATARNRAICATASIAVIER